jgi:ferredoxin
MTTPPNQVRKRFVLTIPATLVNKPIVYELCRDFQVSFNILNASISPAREGRVVIELAGSAVNIRSAELHLGQIGVTVESLNQDVWRCEDRCIHCGTCEGFCPTGALYVERPVMRVVFDEDKCVLCERCLTACPTHAMAFRYR